MNHALRLLAASLLLLLLIAAACQRQAIAQEGVHRERPRDREQAFSRDGSRTWETNWTMDLLRTR